MSDIYVLNYTSGQVITGGTSQYVYSKGVADKTIVVSGGRQIVSSGGITSRTIAKEGGYQYIRQRGRSFSANIQSGGEQYVSTLGIASNTKVSFSGYQEVYDAGYAYNTNVASHASQVIYSHGRAYNNTIYGSQDVRYGGITSNTIIKSGGIQEVHYDSYAYNVKIYSGGLQNVDSGILRDVTIFSNGTANISAGVIRNLKVKNGGKLNLKNSYVESLTNEKQASISFSGDVVFGRENLLSNVTVNDAENTTIVIQNGAKLILGNNVDMRNTTISAGYTRYLNGDLVITGQNNTIQSFSNNWQNISFNIANLKSKNKHYMLTQRIANDSYYPHRGTIEIDTAKSQTTTTYKIAKNIDFEDGNIVRISVGGTNACNMFVGDKTSINGITYTTKYYVNNNNEHVLDLKTTVYGDKIYKGTNGVDKLTGTANSDIFYGGKGNDVITGKNGRDIAVYDKTAWGKDKIVKTNGTMTIIFKDLAKGDVTQKLKGTTMTLTRKNASGQAITVQGWDSSTHNLIFGATLSKFNTYLTKSSPTSSQTKAARNEVWKKAGLASA